MDDTEQTMVNYGWQQALRQPVSEDDLTKLQRSFKNIDQLWPGVHGEQAKMKGFIEKQRDNEDNPDITKYPARVNDPGEEIMDRERGPDSGRKVSRI